MAEGTLGNFERSIAPDQTYRVAASCGSPD
jgi:hypothetical protein